ARSGLLGDPVDPCGEGNPAKWIFGGDPHRSEFLVVVAGDTRGAVDQRSDGVIKFFRSADCALQYEENGNIRPDIPGHEHFGFNDGISQPGIRGRASEQPNDYITPRYIDPLLQPEAWLYGYPGQELVWPGEFVLGYPVTGADPLVPGPSASCVPEWVRNGSFLVFRRLRQNVELFWQT